MKQYEGATSFASIKAYDERGLLISSRQPGGETTNIKYNRAGQPVEMKDPSGKITTMSYAPDGKLFEMRANRDRIRQYISPYGGIEKYEVWNDDTGNGENLSFTYYSTGLIKNKILGSKAISFQYDDVGNQTKVTDPFSTPLAVDYQYDTLNRNTTITAGAKVFTYEYYPDGMVKAGIYPTLDNGQTLKTLKTYDNMNRLKTLTKSNWHPDYFPVQLWV
ncbi:hypothetical protein [Dehalobacterium formicoaceticum]|uniref:YD repeat-containing protein n=1 Tax=Dehalobacterium formicoaceticum TaxID=51515 RepID=A0ABT1Y2T2_9FIRM|nr:hypothetical protein [Dehalobacterium formicoaceticum]MCR6545182.1 hypothetical protein [Dehalobacterium formicoaceticum]